MTDSLKDLATGVDPENQGGEGGSSEAPPETKGTATIEEEILNDPELSAEEFARARSDPGFMEKLVEKRRSSPPDSEEGKGKNEEEEAPQNQAKPEDTQPPQKTKRKRLGGYQRMAGRLQEKIDQTERENAKLREELASRPKPPDSSETETDLSKGKPKEEDYESHMEYLEALTDWKVEQRVSQAEEQRKKAEEQHNAASRRDQAALNILTALHQQATASKQKHEDWEEVVSEAEGIEWSQEQQQAFARTGQFGEIAYYLGSNIEEAERLSQINHLPEFMLELGKVLSAFDSEKPESGDAGGKSKPRKKLPPPVGEKVSGTDPGVVKDAQYWAEKASPQEYAKARREGRI